MLGSLKNRLSRRTGAAAEDPEALRARLEALRAEGAESLTPERAHEQRRLRHRIAATRVGAGEVGADAVREFGPLDEDGLAVAAADDLDGALVRGGILSHGYVLVREMIDRADAERMATKIDAAVAARDADDRESGRFKPFHPDPPYEPIGRARAWVRTGGGLLAVDSPVLFEEMLALLEGVGLRRVIGEFLGDAVMVSAEKCTLRKATPGPPGGWHQDGSFIRTDRALNVWVALSDCGVDAPGLDFVPRRIEELVETGGEGTGLEHIERPEGDVVSAKTVVVGSGLAEEAAGEVGTVRPRFRPGDVMLFDDRFLHRTGSDPEMANPRFAIESWFFAASSFPSNYVPLVF